MGLTCAAIWRRKAVNVMRMEGMHGGVELRQLNNGLHDARLETSSLGVGERKRDCQ